MHELDEVIQHFGVKGMKWGVRRSEKQLRKAKELKTSQNLALKNLKNMSVKLPNGETISVERETPAALARFLGKVSPNMAAQQKRTAIISLKNADGKKIGDAQMYRENKNELNLVWLGVKTSERGRGVGTAVVQAAVGYARKNGLKKLTLEVPGDSPDARHIYEKLGFKATKVLSNKGDDSWGGLTKMEMDISQSKDLKQSEQLGDILDDLLLHYGVKGMKWGVRRTREQIDARLKSFKRERSWKKILKDIDNMSNEDMQKLSNRISRENELKNLTKGRKTPKRDKDAYLRRDKMSDVELNAAVNTLRIRANLKRNINDASKEQRDLGAKMIGIAGPIAIKYAMTGNVGLKDVAISVINPVNVAPKALKGRARKYATDKLKNEK